MKKMIVVNTLILLTLVVHTIPASGTVLYVPGQYSTLASAIDASVAGDTVLVGDGVYTGPENRNLVVANITVVSENGPENCWIDCESQGYAFDMYSNVSNLSVITGFTILNASDEWAFTGAINCNAHNAVINDCILTGSPNIAGICCMNATDVLITNCLIHNNNNSGFLSSISSTELVNCTITQNSVYGAYVVDFSDANFVNCIVTQNDETEVVQNMESNAWFDHSFIDMDPLFVTGPLGDYYLSHTQTGQPANSPCLDAGSSESSAICFQSAYGTTCLDQLTTRTDDVTDSGQVDIGYHYPITLAPTPTTQPCIHHGDVTLDGLITAGDAQLCFTTVMGVYSPTYEEECAADCNGDGNVTAGDAQTIFYAALGMGECVDPL